MQNVNKKLCKKITVIFILFLQTFAFSETIWLEELSKAQDTNVSKQSYIAGMLLHNSYKEFSIEQLQALEKTKVFYQQRGYTTFWLDEDFNFNQNLIDLIKVLKRAPEHGLDTKKYHLDEIFTTISSLKSDGSYTKKEINLIICKLDILLSDAFFTYAKDLYIGELDWVKFQTAIETKAKEKDIDYSWERTEKDIDFIEMLLVLAKEKQIYNGLLVLAPSHKEYKSLQKVLEFYTTIEKAGGWDKIGKGKTLKIDVVDKRISILRKRLFLTNDLPILDTQNNRFDEELKKAVMNFQKRHGIWASGAVKKQTFNKLNISVQDKIEIIKMNLDRYRWEVDHFDKNYISVNIVNFMMRFVRNSEDVLKMKVIVGKKKRPTPIFSDKMSYVVLNPYWRVPSSLARKDLLKKIQNNPDYLLAKNFKTYNGWGRNRQEVDVFDVDWLMFTEEEDLPFSFIQEPGISNPLGKIKFMFPNRHAVYMHDTPKKKLFKKQARMYSSGCIRLHKPNELVEYLANNFLNSSNDYIKKILKTKENKTVFLQEKIPVHMRYITSWTGDKGLMHFGSDVYGYDKIQKKIIQE